MTPTTCLRCHIPLAASTPSGLCPTCQGIEETLPAPEQPRGPFGLTRSADSDDRTTVTPGVGLADQVPALQRIISNPPTGYVLQEELGHGGMGYVYKALETDADRIVAIKFLRDRLNAAANSRFRTEVQALSRVHHPNVVPILSINLNHDDPYFTMEYEPNGSLATVIKEKTRLTPDESAKIVEQLAYGLAAIHAKDVLHRDLKPQNILLAGDGTPKLADLGLAKQIDKVDDQTQTGALIGTLNYMAPEQAGKIKRGIDARTDVYGLGAVLYQCLTGKAPFPGSDPQTVLKRIQTEYPAPPRQAYPDVSKDLEAVCLKCLEKDPASRYQSATELAEDLGRCRRGESPEVKPFRALDRIRRRIARNRIAIGVGFLFLAIISTAALMLYDRESDPVVEYHRALLAKKRVQIVPHSGMPRWEHRILGLAPLGLKPVAENACAVDSVEQTMYLFIPSIPINSYSLSASLLELDTRGLAGGIADPFQWSGILFGYAVRPGPSGELVHSGFAVTFSDFDLNAGKNAPPVPRPVKCRHFYIVEQPGFSDKPITGAAFGNTTFIPTAIRPGPWRTIAVQVGMDRFVVDWKNEDGSSKTVVDATSEMIRSQIENSREQLAAKFPDLIGTIPDWSPRGGMGLWCAKSSVAVRDFTIDPNP